MKRSTFRLGQVVTHRELGVTVTIVGMMEPNCGDEVLVDWDGTGVILWWCEASDLAACEEAEVA